MLRTFAGGRLFGSATGKGRASVLALHGWGRSHSDFDAMLRPALTDAPGPRTASATAPTAADAELPAIALDLPGFGAAPPPSAPWGSPEYAAHVGAVLDEMETPVVVVAHSFGGRVALHLATARPADVRALVLTSVPLLRLAPARRPAASYRAVRAAHRLGLVSDTRLERARQRHGSADYRAATGVMREVFVRVVGEGYERQLDALGCPVSLVWGDDDATVPLEVARRALSRLETRSTASDAELVVCPGAGHLLPLTAPDALRAAVQGRLGSRRRALTT